MLLEKKVETMPEDPSVLHADQTDPYPQETSSQEDPFEGKEGTEIIYDLQEEEVKRQLLFLQKKQIYRRNIIYTCIMAALFILHLVTVINNPSYPLGMLMMAISAGVIVVIWVMAWKYRSSQAKAVSAVKEGFRMTVFENGILVKQENGNFHALFSEPKFRVWDREGAFLLDLNRQRIYILPHRCMSVEQIDILRQYFKDNLVEEKK